MLILQVIISLAIFGEIPTAHAQVNDFVLWRDFVASLKGGRFTIDQISPYEFISRENLMTNLMSLKEGTDQSSTWHEWEVIPEVFPVDNHVHFLISLSFGDTTTHNFCFTFIKEGERWYFRHMENIFIRLDQLSGLPASEFPDLPAATKAWQREEIYWSQIVYFYTVFARDRGVEYVLNLLKDGAGYYLASKTWVPFLPPQRAFILYLCWEQSRLRENQVILDTFTAEEAIVRLQTHFFYLYKRTGHLKTQISLDDYRRIFETIWQDRAAHAGWNLDIRYEDAECLQCVFHFTAK